ncbi:MAG: cell wall hydrolase [Ruminococcus sp.]|nr:cell wall hydrolase [Ruminococcus sp.]
MSENEKFTAEVAETVAGFVTEQDIKLATPQESNPLENDSAKAFGEEIENPEIAEDVEKEDRQNWDEKLHTKKMVGATVAAAAMLILSLGVVSSFGFSNRGVTAGIETTKDTTKAKTTTFFKFEDEKDEAQVGTISWWKAGFEEYNFIDFDEEIVTTTKKPVTTTTVTTTKPKPESTTSSATTTKKPATTTTVTTTQKKPTYTEQAIDKTTFYLTTNVNLRKGPGTSYTKLVTLKKDTAVVAVVKVSNGWYKVEANGYTGYLIDDYLTTKKPAVTTTTTQKVETTTPEPSTPGSKPVISYTDEELEMFYYVVEGEVGGCSEKSKLVVANVIINRVKSPRFANTLKGVMTAKSQFTAINNYYSKKRTPTKSTIDCVNRALYGEDNSLGALYFYSKKYCSASTAAWFESLTFCLEIDGQRYFKT